MTETGTKKNKRQRQLIIRGREVENQSPKKQLLELENCGKKVEGRMRERIDTVANLKEKQSSLQAFQCLLSNNSISCMHFCRKGISL